MPTAYEIKTKLEADLFEAKGALGRAERHRRTLALPAHNGDAEAALQIVDLRAEVERHKAQIVDLEQAVADIEPRVQAEEVAAKLAARERLFAEFQTARKTMLAATRELDKQIAAVLAAYHAAAEPIGLVRKLAIECLYPTTPAADPSDLARRRMACAAWINVETLDEDFEDVVRRGRQGRSAVGMAERFTNKSGSVELRLKEALREVRSAASQSIAQLTEEVAA